MFVDPLKARHGPRIPRPCLRTVTKLALNILSTGTMVLLGKVYGNHTVDGRSQTRSSMAERCE
jgi:N-acetylmuramic acid 6-phosphate (MurNAc-6-P) etherase